MMDEGLKLLLAIIAVLGALFLAAGTLAGAALVDVRHTRAALYRERSQCYAVTSEVKGELNEISKRVVDLAKHRKDAVNAWRVQRLAESDKELERILAEQQIAGEQVRRLKDWDQSKRGRGTP